MSVRLTQRPRQDWQSWAENNNHNTVPYDLCHWSVRVSRLKPVQQRQTVEANDWCQHQISANRIKVNVVQCNL